VSLNLSIKTTGIKPNLFEQMERRIKRDFKRACKNVQLEAQNLAPVKTGQLKNSIELVDLGDSVFIGSKTPYAGYMEFGTKKIRPVAFLRRALAKLLLKFKASVI